MKMRGYIIARIKNLEYNGLPSIGYIEKYKNDYDFITKEKIILPRFIRDLIKAKRIFYSSSIEIAEYSGILSVCFPFIKINRNSIFFDFNYYARVYYKNTRAGIINKRYIINYELIGLYNFNKIDMEIKKMELVFPVRFDV